MKPFWPSGPILHQNCPQNASIWWLAMLWAPIGSFTGYLGCKTGTQKPFWSTQFAKICLKWDKIYVFLFYTNKQTNKTSKSIPLKLRVSKLNFVSIKIIQHLFILKIRKVKQLYMNIFSIWWINVVNVVFMFYVFAVVLSAINWCQSIYAQIMMINMGVWIENSFRWDKKGPKIDSFWSKYQGFLAPKSFFWLF